MSPQLVDFDADGNQDMVMGTFEGVHYDTNITTGVQAYNHGMQYLIEQNNTNELYGDIGVGPIFPYQYTHAKRTCNDTHDDIGNTEYQLNSTAYGAWWLNRLFISDPGSCGFDPAESNSKVYKSRFISSLINGGIVRLENNLTDTNQQALVEGGLDPLPAGVVEGAWGGHG